VTDGPGVPDLPVIDRLTVALQSLPTITRPCETVHVVRSDAGLGGPQPHRRGITVLRWILGLQPERVLGQRNFTVVVEP
jgi:hypothetical protein